MTTFIEEIYESNVPIKYVFEAGKRHKDSLIIIFSDSNGNEVDELNKYDYLAELKNIDCNKLFILDNYGPKGCYYLGFNLNFEVETSVASLISYITRITNVHYKNIIMVGTNKGGSAALYFGLKYNMGNIIVGNPHIRIAEYILKNEKVTAEYLLGFNPSKFEIEKLNQLIINQLNKNVLSKIFLLNGDSPKIKNHTDIIVKELANRNIVYEHSETTEVENFNDVNNVFPKYLLMQLSSLLHNININEVDFNKNMDGNCLIQIDTDNHDWILENDIHLVLSDEDGLIKQYYMEDQIIIPHSELMELVDEPKLVSFGIKVSRKSTTLLEIPLEQLLISKHAILKGIEFTFANGNLSFAFDIEDSPELEYAYYVRKNNKIVEKHLYTPSREIKVPIESPGKYQIQYFVRNKENEIKILSQRTEAIEVDSVLLATK